LKEYKSNIESIYNLSQYLKVDNFLPIYFLFGEDTYTISNAVKEIIKQVEPLVTTDFDKETVNLSKDNNVSQFTDHAYAFPFGDGKKLIIVKGFENISDKKQFADYVNDPAEFTILIVIQHGKKVNLKIEPYSALSKKKYLFEAKELRGAELQQWLIRKAKKEGLQIDADTAWLLIEMVGEHKALLEMQLQKFYNFLDEKKEITPDVIESLATVTKEYTIFNLQDALGEGNKAKSLEVGYNLLENGNDMVFIISMLTRYVTTLAQIIELRHKKIADNSAATEAGVSFYYYRKCKNARYLLNEDLLLNAGKALLNADIAIKTSSADKKTVLTILLSEILR